MDRVTGTGPMQTRAADSDLGELTNIEFPRNILEGELTDIMKYLVVHFDTPVQIMMHYEGRERFGSLDGVHYDTINDVPRYLITKKFSGQIQTRDMKCADFAAEVGYDEHNRQVYKGLIFFLVPGCEQEDLTSCNKGIMRETKRHIGDYFVSTDED